MREKLGRRDPCPCGSGLAYRRCCLKSGRYDGSQRHHYFQRAPVIRRFSPGFRPNVTPERGFLRDTGAPQHRCVFTGDARSVQIRGKHGGVGHGI
ncbi:MAG: SEC-C metal-binding domain-containing protein [Pseudomonadota bacterium]